ncbi:MAG: tetratricopeptide repeat protein [Planctomycetaceae bacterium]|nr:tetratricopeptide repeat protein [Planctomycetaceae bacterium]
MYDQPDYSQDSEFQKLVARHSDVDLTQVALELARDAYPNLDIAEPWNWIRQRAGEIRPQLAFQDEVQSISSLSACLADRHGLTGTSEAYEDPDASYLPCVMETGRGIPISLSTIYMAVANQVGMSLQGVSAPLHFLSSIETSEGTLFIDAYAGGRILTFPECLDWLKRLTNFSESELSKALEPVGPREIVVRMLNNLKVLYAKREEWPAAWKVQHRLSTIQPGSYNERRDLGIISLHAGRFNLAVDVLSACVAKCPAEEREILEGHLKHARSKLSEWN